MPVNIEYPQYLILKGQENHWIQKEPGDGKTGWATAREGRSKLKWQSHKQIMP